MFRILLLGESPRFNVPKAGNAAAEGLGCSSLFDPSDTAVTDLDRGAVRFGDSGDELGEGSVSVVSIVEIVVVGDDSTDSDVTPDSFRNKGEDA